MQFSEAYVAEDLVLRTANSLAREVGLDPVSPGAGAALRLLAAAGNAEELGVKLRELPYFLREKAGGSRRSGERPPITPPASRLLPPRPPARPIGRPVGGGLKSE